MKLTPYKPIKNFDSWLETKREKQEIKRVIDYNEFINILKPKNK